MSGTMEFTRKSSIVSVRGKDFTAFSPESINTAQSRNLLTKRFAACVSTEAIERPLATQNGINLALKTKRPVYSTGLKGSLKGRFHMSDTKRIADAN